MKLIVFATEREALPTLKQLQAKPTAETHCFSFSQGLVLISGIGLLAAAQTVARYSACATEVWNLGIAGSLKAHLPLGQLVEVKQVLRYGPGAEFADTRSHSWHSRLFPPLSLQTEGYSLLSCDYPLHEETLSSRLAAHADLVDMEGYGIAYAAAQRQLPCKLYKVMTDHARLDGPVLIERHLQAASESLAAFLKPLIAP